jgi:uncharacterized membrane protein
MKDCFFWAIIFSLVVSATGCNSPLPTGGSGSPATGKTDTVRSPEGTIVAKQQDSVSRKPIFKASGNEPFWGITIDARDITFTSLAEGFNNFIVPFSEPIQAMDANVKMYQSQSGAGEIKVQVFQSSCIDDMSGKKTNYKTTIEIKRPADKQFKIFSGCGDYLSDDRIYDIWVLREIDGKPAPQNLNGKEIPRIEINSTDRTFLAFTGDREIQGKIFMEGNSITFTTYKVPPGLNATENNYLDKLRSVVSFKLKENHLLLSDSRSVLLKFQKVD